ncbi:BZ3500_MvSof-1268-A1-R1_Chr4-2g06982 [Microbotryum saponariae]|uniref:transketolase n=1 Tax=Microbotryum saponariae TaxID=289078 RepID=A0A2X0KVJ3_9BASI|nr:BZ3500_MvSof-1268-A1-R1_Chr4-2g06982 [Microbotryum saponariae]SDA06647.1 BZ3501_MvSof-1269-A2-R1_Chr4-2g06693 [Microbotryum saponariae]
MSSDLLGSKFTDDDTTAVNTIRTLALDLGRSSARDGTLFGSPRCYGQQGRFINRIRIHMYTANSGHPGAPMGMAVAAHVLFSRVMNLNPKNPHWVNRDRFVLSNGHACALQYVLLHLLGYKVTIDDLKSFRQLDSITPGHPEVGVTEGIEVTTGPLGQGFANAVGLAIAQAHLGATFNKDGFPIFDNYTYMFTGDGCLMEGISSEAASLAGHLKLGNLIAVYDDNHISIDGDTAIAFTENVAKRFESYDWQVLIVSNGDDGFTDIFEAIEAAKKETSKPTLIQMKTTIGYGSKDQGTHSVHGNPLKKDDTINIKQEFGFNPEEFFAVPEATKKIYGAVGEKGAKTEAAWQKMFDEYSSKYPEEAADIKRRIAGKLPDGWEKALPTFTPSDAAVASRKLSETLLGKLSVAIPELMSGSADLTPSNLTRWSNAVDFQPKENGLGDFSGRYLRYGVREHGMGAIMNGLAAFGPNFIIPAAGTFLNFVSYAAGAVRLAALSHLRVIWVATHDSIGLGEDGPTHQPIETVAHFRALPNCNVGLPLLRTQCDQDHVLTINRSFIQVWRPADGNETSAAYYMALTSTHTPSIIALSRQNLPQLEGSSLEKANKGGYVLHDAADADLTLVSTGSEVSIIVEAAKALEKKGLKVRVVSLPCWEIFDQQSKDYRLSVFPDGAPVVSVEAYTTLGWSKYAHESIGINTFGASGPYLKVYEKFGITGENVAAKSQQVVDAYKKAGHFVVSPLNKVLL